MAERLFKNKHHRCLDYDYPRLHDFFTYISAIVLLYLFIYQPPVINKVFYVIAEAMIFIIILFVRSRKLLALLRLYKYEHIILMTIIIYALFRDISSGEIVYSDRFLVWVFQTFFFGTVILLYFQDKKVSFISIVYWASFIAALISVALLLFPPFDNWYKSIDISGIYEQYKTFKIRYRGYGIAENLTFTYAFVMGMFSGYSLLLIKKSYFYIIPFFIFLLAMIFNARIGFVGLLFFIGYLVFVRHDIKGVFHFFFSALLMILFSYCYLLYKGIDTSSLIIFSNLDWILDFFLDILGSSDTNQPSTLSTMFGKFIILPDDSISHFIFGTGESLFGRKVMSSDMGYILQLYYGGLLFLLLIIFLIWFNSYRLVKTLGIKHWFTSFFFIAIVILNTKGFIFAATPGGRLIFLLYMYFIMKNVVIKSKKNNHATS